MIRASTAATPALGSWAEATSQNTGVPPVARTAAAAATNAREGTTTSSPASRPTARQARWSAAVPLDTQATDGAPSWSARAPSSAWVRGPMVSQPSSRHAIDGLDVVLGHLQRAQRVAEAHARNLSTPAITRSCSSAVMCGYSGSVTSARVASSVRSMPWAG